MLCVVAGSLGGEEKARVRKLPRATLRELAALEVPPPQARERRHEEPRVFGEHTRDGRRGVSTEADPPRLTTAATIAPPPIATGFPADSTGILSPADASGAVSKTHVVAASNIGITVLSRTGTRLVSATLGQFWHGAGGGILDEVYDPRVLYDAAANRWVTVAIDDAAAVLLGVSKSGDPTGEWIRYEIPVNGCDFTRLALTRDTILVSTLIDDANASAILSFQKAELYAGEEDLSIGNEFLDGDAVPVHAPESNVEYVVSSGDSHMILFRLDTQQFASFDSGFLWEYPFDDYSPAGVTRALSIGFGDVQAAVLRDGWLYAVHRIGTSNHTPDGNALLWWKIDPTGARPHELGVINSPNGTVYAYPSLAVNRKGGMVIGFCTFSATTFPSASFVYRDPAGRVSTPRVIATGDSRVAGTDRWGDYTTVVEDPLNGHDFWIGQIRATRNSWETWWANVKVPLPKARSARH
ncbi:MAG TPA: hypothetical protein VEK79_15010 [Thermoanaerobaculia bacterium]|nr:hypothetical protein [Thermoanaerobaculia bacterium]